MQPTRESKLEPMPCVLLWVKGRGTHQLLQKPHTDLGNVRFSKLDSRVNDCDCWGKMPIQVRSVITSGFTGHEQTSNHFTPARMSAPCASYCYPAIRFAVAVDFMASVWPRSRPLFQSIVLESSQSAKAIRSFLFDLVL